MLNKIKNLILIFYRPISKILFYFKRIFTFHLHLGSPDYYPDNESIKGGVFNIFKNDEERVEFWTKLAKKHNTLRHFYSENPESSFLNNFDKSKFKECDEITLKSLTEFYQNGVVEIPNFFNQEEHNLINEFFEKKINTKLSNLDKYSWKSYASDLNKTIHNKIKIFEKIIFNKKIGIQKYTLSAWKKQQNNTAIIIIPYSRIRNNIK